MLNRNAPASVAPTLAADAAPPPLTLLLVDDNKTFVTAVRQFLDRMPGVQVIGHAHDGKAALAQQREHNPALVLLDIGMPGMNGLELARAMLQDDAPPQLVFLSMHDNREYRAAARELGADFVSKADFVTELLPLLGARAQALAAAGAALRERAQ
jgi:DNA-binding NarL/FixJ family response regulator